MRCQVAMGAPGRRGGLEHTAPVTPRHPRLGCSHLECAVEPERGAVAARVQVQGVRPHSMDVPLVASYGAVPPTAGPFSTDTSRVVGLVNVSAGLSH